MRIADSSAFDGANPGACNWAAFAAVCQSSLVAITAWSDWRTSESVGLASAFAMPYCASDGPVATIARRLGAEPPTMKPPIITSFPVSTCMRVEILLRRGGSLVHCAAPADEVVPAGHTVWPVAPDVETKKPADAGVQADCPLSAWKVPGEHCVALVCPSAPTKLPGDA